MNHYTSCSIIVYNGSSRFLASKFMREFVVHFAWILTHVVRTFTTGDPSLKLYSELLEEVRVLQAELHRAQQLLEGYNTILKRANSSDKLYVRSSQIFTVILTVLTLILWWSWYKPSRLQGRTPASVVFDSESSESEPEKRLVRRAAKPPGPLRPSALGKGRR